MQSFIRSAGAGEHPPLISTSSTEVPAWLTAQERNNPQSVFLT